MSAHQQRQLREEAYARASYYEEYRRREEEARWARAQEETEARRGQEAAEQERRDKRRAFHHSRGRGWSAASSRVASADVTEKTVGRYFGKSPAEEGEWSASP